MSSYWRLLPHCLGTNYAPLSDGNRPQDQQNLHQPSQRNLDYNIDNGFNLHPVTATQAMSSSSARGGQPLPISVQPGSPTLHGQKGSEYLASLSRSEMPPISHYVKGHPPTRSSSRLSTEYDFNNIPETAHKENQRSSIYESESKPIHKLMSKSQGHLFSRQEEESLVPGQGYPPLTQNHKVAAEDNSDRVNLTSVSHHNETEDQSYRSNEEQNHQNDVARLDYLLDAFRQHNFVPTPQKMVFDEELGNPRTEVKQAYSQEHPSTRLPTFNYSRKTLGPDHERFRDQKTEGIQGKKPSRHFRNKLGQQTSSKIFPSDFNTFRPPATVEQWGEPAVDDATESGGRRLFGHRCQVEDNKPYFITKDKDISNTYQQQLRHAQWPTPHQLDFSKLPAKEIHYSPETKPPTYNGRGSFDDYITQFQCLARVKHWSLEEMGIKLVCALEGNAVGVLGTIPEHLQADFMTLKGALMSRFSPKLDQDINGALCNNRRKKRGETYMAFAQDLKKLVRMSYGNGWNPTQIEVLTREKFFNAINDFQLKAMIWARKPTTVEEAALMADSLQRLQQNQGNLEGRLYGLSGQSQSRPQREKEVSDESKSDADDSKDNNKYENDRRSKVQCYYCHQFGHYARECQVRKRNLRSRGGNQERKD